MKYSTLFAIGLFMLLPLQADAKQGKHKQKGTATPEEIFKKKDTNGDGMLSKDEFIAKKKDPTKAEKRFAKLDTNSDGKVSLEELKAKKNKAGKGGKKAGKGGKKAGKKHGKKHGKKNK